MDIKVSILVGMIVLSAGARAECVARASLAGQLVLSDSEFAYEVRTFGPGYRDYTGEVIEQIERTLTDVRAEAARLRSGSLDGDNAAMQSDSTAEILAKQKIAFGLAWGERMYSLPVEKTIKGPEKHILVVTQSSEGDSTGFKSGGKFVVIVDAKNPYRPISRCLIIKIEGGRS